MRKSKIALFFLSGLVGGIFLAQGLFVLAGRSGGNFGGEMLILPLMFLLVYMGVVIGRMFPDKHQERELIREGYRLGLIGAQVKHDTIEIIRDYGPADCDKAMRGDPVEP